MSDLRLASREPISTKVQALAALILALVGLLTFVVANAKPTLVTTPEVRITFPVDETLVSQTETIQGTSQSIPAGSVIWVVVYSPDVGRYYPQNEPAVMDANGVWSSRTFIGMSSDANLRFDIIALVADVDIQASFNAYQSDSRAKGEWLGLQSLSVADAVLDRLSVRRR